MAELVKLLEKNKVSTETDDQIENIEKIIKRYIKSGGTIKSSKVDKILFLTHPIDYNPIYVYEILINYGYQFKNNLVLLNVLLMLSFISSLEEYIKEAKTYETRKIKYVNLYKYFENLFENNQLVITDNDIDNYIKINTDSDVIDDIISDIKYYNLNTSKTNLKFPKIVLNLNKYKSVFEKISSYLI